MMINTAQLKELIEELHQANEALAESARPLKRHSELGRDQRQHIADQLRAGMARWENVTQRIGKVLMDDAASARREDAA